MSRYNTKAILARNVWPACLLILLGCATGTPTLSPDERVILFPAHAFQNSQGQWQLSIRAWFFEPESDSAVRRGMRELLHEIIETDDDALPKGFTEEAEERIFDERSRWFLVDNERNKQIQIRLGNQTHPLQPSDSNGHSTTEIALSSGPLAAELERQRRQSGSNHQPINVPMEAESGNRSYVHSPALFIPRRGISVISDIDDTIKITNVNDRSELIRRTFLRKFEAVPGMAAVYREWQRRGYAFHYVSGSPWQLYPPLQEFMQAAGFPAGSFHLRLFRLKDDSFLDFIQSDGLEYKSPAIADLLKAYPDRIFILVGDSGEQDPEVYARIAHQFPDQIKAICIRDVTGEQESHARYRKLGIPAHITLRVFQDASELKSSEIIGL